METETYTPAQFMLWTDGGVKTLIGMHVTFYEAEGDYWTNPDTYNGTWREMCSGVVTYASLKGIVGPVVSEAGRHNAKGYAEFADRSSVSWIPGQAIRIDRREA